MYFKIQERIGNRVFCSNVYQEAGRSERTTNMREGSDSLFRSPPIISSLGRYCDGFSSSHK